MSAIKEITLRSMSPLKMVKRKIGYGSDDEEDYENSQQRMKRLTLQDRVVDNVDAAMST